jgi:hypothetical protein
LGESSTVFDGDCDSEGVADAGFDAAGVLRGNGDRDFGFVADTLIDSTGEIVGEGDGVFDGVRETVASIGDGDARGVDVG